MFEFFEMLRVGNETIEYVEPVQAIWDLLKRFAAPVVGGLLGFGASRSAARQKQREAEAQRRRDRANRMYGWASGFGAPTRVTPEPSMLAETMYGTLAGAKGGFDLLQQHRDRQRRQSYEDRIRDLKIRTWEKLLRSKDPPPPPSPEPEGPGLGGEIRTREDMLPPVNLTDATNPPVSSKSGRRSPRPVPRPAPVSRLRINPLNPGPSRYGGHRMIRW